MMRLAATRDAQHGQAASERTEPDSPGAVLRGAVHVVFGMPFLFCLFVATRGHLWAASHRLLGDAVGRNFSLIWPITASLGGLWLGVGLMLQPVPGRRPAGALLVLAGSALLVLLNS